MAGVGEGGSKAGESRLRRVVFWTATVLMFGVALGLCGVGAYEGPYATLTAKTGTLWIDHCKIRSNHTRKNGVQRSSACKGQFETDDGSIVKRSVTVKFKATDHYKGEDVDVDWVNGEPVYAVARNCAYWSTAICVGLLVASFGWIRAVTGRPVTPVGKNPPTDTRYRVGRAGMTTAVAGIVLCGMVIAGAPR